MVASEEDLRDDDGLCVGRVRHQSEEVRRERGVRVQEEYALALIDEALGALLARRRGAEVDASYAVYDATPLDEPDAWGDLASFRRAAAAS